MKVYVLPLLLLLVACTPKNTTKEATTQKNNTAQTHPYSPANIQEQIIYNRAMEAVIWGMPIVNDDLMFQAFKSNGGDFNQIAYWGGLVDWKNQTLTPNPGTIYFMPFINTKDVGPMVLEIPATGEDGSMTGNICDFWQCALEDAGPAGADKGKGGKYLILPPGYKEKIPAGYISLPSATYQNYALLRSILKDGSSEGIAKAIEYGKKVKLYPLSAAANPSETVFKDMKGKMFDATISYDIRFFQSLDRIIQIEPWQERDRAFIDILASIGIKKGQPFNPDAKQQALLEAGIHDANIWIDDALKTSFPKFYEGGQWLFPGVTDVIKGQSDNYADVNSYPITARAISYSMLFIGVKHLGAGQYYLYTPFDKNGKPLRASVNYCLHVPANVPIKQYWSATLYDAKTHALIREAQNATISSQTPALQKNSDGSVDLYFGPKAPAGKESNWIDSGPTKEFEVLMRFYAPEKPLFDKTWRLGDVEEVQ